MFGKRITQLRKDMGLSRDELAEKMSINTVTLYKLEKSINFAGAETLEKLASALGVSYKDLFNFGETTQEKHENILAKLKMLDDNNLENVNAIIDAFIEKQRH